MTSYKVDTILQGSAHDKLKELPNEFVDCIITSPPYWSLRDYKVEGQIGVEKTIDEYVNNLINVFSEVKRVLKKDGTCWVVLGDTYASGGGLANEQSFRRNSGIDTESNPDYPAKSKLRSQLGKCLLMIPERFAIKMIEKGWILRNKIIWHKPNCMPSSAKDRFTIDYEYVYFFVKSKNYYFKTQYEKSLAKWERWGGNIIKKPIIPKGINEYAIQYRERENNPNGEETRIKRCVWKVPTKPFTEAHFAVFPESLVQQCLDAGCPSEICKKCKKSPIIEEIKIGEYQAKWSLKRHDNSPYNTSGKSQAGILNKYDYHTFYCNCNAGFESGIVLDPFIGSGTTALVALKNNRKFIGIELNPDYINIATKRIDPYLKQAKLI